MFNAGLGARLGVFYYAYVIPGLGLFEGTCTSTPSTTPSPWASPSWCSPTCWAGRIRRAATSSRVWSDKVSKTKVQSALLSVVAMIVIGNVVYGAVFAPHLVTKLRGDVTSGPSGQLFPGVPNQPR